MAVTSCSSIVILAGTATAPSVTFSTDKTTGFYVDDNFSINCTTNGVLRAIFSDAITLKQYLLTDITSSTTDYIKLFVDDSGNLQQIDNNNNITYAGMFLSKIPRNDFANFSLTGLQKYIDTIAYCNNPYGAPWRNTPPTLPDIADGYQGGVVAGNKYLYYVPYAQCYYTIWHYMDPENQQIHSYWATSDGQDPGTLVNPYGADAGYWGGAYDPIHGYIYFAPYNVGSTWQYVDTNTGFVNTLSGFSLVADAYRGAVYSPKQNRIYFAPYGQAVQSTWHYINCSTGAVVAYAHGMAGLSSGAYQAGCYSPDQNRIYFAPANQAWANAWHYIDCNTGSVVAYGNPTAQTVGRTFPFATYSPTENKIYFTPETPGTTSIVVLNCYSNTLTEITRFFFMTPSTPFVAAVYSPVHNFIFLVYDRSTPFYYTQWPYIDCSNGTTNYYLFNYNTYNYFDMCSAQFIPGYNVIYTVPKVVDSSLSGAFAKITDYDAGTVVVSDIFALGALYNRS